MVRGVGRSRRWAVVAAVAVVTAVAPLLPGGTAVADTAPPVAGTPLTVSADVLPTVQINGVVWAQLVVGNTVYATGEFTSARPAGSPAGTNEVPRANIVAYDITTGVMSTTWAPSLNAQGMALAASADGQTIFVGGSFTQVNGVNRNRIAALDATTGALRTSFPQSAGTDARVNALAVRGDTLYLGGIFSAAGGQVRTRLAAYTASTGALLPWNASANDEVKAVVAPATSSKVVVGGRFTTLNGEANYGLGALDPATGGTVAFPTNQIVRDAGANAAIYSLTTNGAQIFGTGYTFGSGGNFENIFSADAATGNLIWVSGCLGDTYSAAPVGDVVYLVSHTHACSQIGYFPEQSPRTWQRALAYRTGLPPDGRVNTGGSFNGRPAPEALVWAPSLQAGTYTGATQAAWTVAGSGDYVLLGGEFPSINGVAQQGLARFAKTTIAPNKEGAQGYADLAPTITGISPGTVRASWKASWDRDNVRSTYELLRGPALTTATVVASTAVDSQWWSRPTIALTDTSAPPGTSQSYRVRVTDPKGNVQVGPTVVGNVPAGTSTPTPYARLVQTDGAVDQWRLGEPSGTVGYDALSVNNLTLTSAAQRGTAGAVVGDSDTATTFTGTGAAPASTTGTAQAARQVFSVEAWFRTTTTTGGKIVGYGNSATGSSTSYDRHVYMASNGQLVLGVSSGGTARTVTSPAAYNNGQWHHVVGTLGAGGLTLYVDGAQVANRTDTTSAAAYNGYWRVGGDTVGTAWPTRPATQNFSGAIDDVAVYPTALPAATVASHFQVGNGALPNQPPVASFTSATTALTVAFDASGSTDPDGTVAGYAWNFGDGQTGTGVNPQHAYAAAGTYTVGLTVTDNSGATNATTRTVTAVAPNQPPTAAFTETVTNNAVAFTGTGSTDPDGTVTGYAWTFGDGQTGTGPSPQHNYPAAGTYTVGLTVTDNAGATGTTSHTVTTTDPPANTVVATDAFGRTVASGLGTADAGGAWTTTGTGVATSVADGSARLAADIGKTGTARLAGTSSLSTDVLLTTWYETMPTGGGVIHSTTVRSTAGGDYRARVKILSTGAAQVSITKVVAGTETALTSSVTIPGLTYTAGTKLAVRAEAVGASPTTLRMRVWVAGTAEPTTWQVSVTDATAGLQVAGSVGFVVYNSGTATAGAVARVDDLSATTVQ